MSQKAASLARMLPFLGAGLLLGIVPVVLQLVLARESPVVRFLHLLEWPVAAAIDRYVAVFHGGNSDHFIIQGLLLWGLYWLALGAIFGFAGYGIWRFLRKERGE